VLALLLVVVLFVFIGRHENVNQLRVLIGKALDIRVD
jgi:hypothetical protein